MCDMDGPKARPFVPKQSRDLIIRMYHQLSHPGQRKTLDKVKASYFWSTMGKDVSLYVRSCQTCQAVKPYKEIRPPMSKMKVPDTKFSELQIDVVGPMPQSENMKYLLTIIDGTTRWIEAVPMPEATSDNCCKAFLRGWVQHFGLPSRAQSDNGNAFVSNLWRDLHQTLGIKVDYTPPYHSASLGAIERKQRYQVGTQDNPIRHGQRGRRQMDVAIALDYAGTANGLPTRHRHYFG